MTSGVPGSQDDELKQALKELIVRACKKDIDPRSIADDDTLIGFGSQLGLDSLDVLQINVEISRQFNKRIEDSKHARRVMRNVQTLADYIQPGDA